MEMLNSISLLLANNFWANIINLFAKWIVNYGWAIIVFTICLKLLMTPLDILQRSASQKQAKVSALMQPEMAKLQAKYGNDKEKLNQEQAKLYKKYNVNLGGMCFSLLITMVISLVIVFTLYSSLRSYGNDKLYTTYQDLESAYIQAETHAQTISDEDLKREYIVEAIETKYDEQSKQNSWLWVKNVWKSDTFVSQFVNFDEYASYRGFDETQKAAAKTRYDDIVSIVIDEGEKDQNGYYVLIILAAVISFLTQFLSTKLNTPKGQKLNTMNLVMFAVIPITILILAFTSNVVFTLYITVNSIMTALISTVITLIMRRKNNGDDSNFTLPKKTVEVVEYSRNYKK